MQNRKTWRARGTKPRNPGNEYELYMSHEVSASQHFYYNATPILFSWTILQPYGIIIQQIVTMPTFGKEALNICHPT